MHSRFSYLAIASLAAIAFSGCEWGGAHENTWNDGYSWANFTGTYRFVNAVYYTPSAISTSTEETATSTEATAVSYPTRSNSNNARMSTGRSASGTISPVVNGIVPGSVQLKIKNNSVTISDDGSKGLIYNGSTVGTVDYKSGVWSFSNLPIAANLSKNDDINITYKYYGKAGGGNGGGNGGGGSEEEGSNAVYLSFLKVTQQGNKLTMVGDNGLVYKGQLTGASTGKNGYVAAQQVRLAFEASAANGMKMTGHFSGQWSGATDKEYGVLSERTIQGTHNRAGNFVGVAADTTIKVPDLAISEIGVSGYGGTSE